MSTVLTKKQKELLHTIEIATDPENAKFIKESLQEVKKAKKKLSELIHKLEEVNQVDKLNNRENAITTYKYNFITVSSKSRSKKEKIAIKKALTPGEIAKIFDKKNKLSDILFKLKKTRRILKKIIGPCEKALKFYEDIHKVADTVNKVDDLLKQQDGLKTPEDYRKYYLGLAGDFSTVATNMKSITSLLPKGASDYCEFIFTVAENGIKAAKIVSNYSERIITLAKEVFPKLRENAYGKKSYFTTGRDASSFNSNEIGVEYSLKNK